MKICESIFERVLDEGIVFTHKYMYSQMNWQGEIKRLPIAKFGTLDELREENWETVAEYNREKEEWELK